MQGPEKVKVCWFYSNGWIHKILEEIKKEISLQPGSDDWSRFDF